jgi:serine/threonine protein phosphatase PrpC
MGGQMSNPITDINTRYHKDNNIEAVGGTIQGWRNTMEDFILFESSLCLNEKNCSLFGIFDGHGGDVVSKYCAENFIDHFRTVLDETHDFELAMSKVFQYVDEKLLKDIEHDLTFTGTTVAICLIVHEEEGMNGYIAYLGDSLIVFFGRDRCTFRSESHTTSNPKEMERLKDCRFPVQYGRIDGKIEVTRALGDFYFKDYENGEFPVSFESVVHKFSLKGDDDFIILTSDGILESITPEDFGIAITKHSLQHSTLEDFPKHMFKYCLKEDATHEMSTDNMSLIVIKVVK